jgi:hypothetical protein
MLLLMLSKLLSYGKYDWRAKKIAAMKIIEELGR